MHCRLSVSGKSLSKILPGLLTPPLAVALERYLIKGLLLVRLAV